MDPRPDDGSAGLGQKTTSGARSSGFERVRRGTTVVVSTWAGLMVAKLLRWLLGLGELRGLWLTAMAVSLGLAGLAGGVVQAREQTPMDPRERRDAVLGWGTIAVVLAAIVVYALVTEGL